jgi:hypothetical protein
MGVLRKMSDKVSEVTDKYGLANPIEVADEALGGQTREESKARREKEKAAEVKSAEPVKPPTKMKAGGKVAGKLATRGYGISKHGKVK